MVDQPLTVDAILCAAIDIDSLTERKAFVVRACGSDRQLRQRVEKLIDAHFRAGGFLESQPPGLEAIAAAAPIGEQRGPVIDRYKLLQQIGEGGFGVVFMAEQQAPVKRKVALKVIKVGMDTKDVIARFEAERQALAMMDHPNIAKVLDAGATESGRPYFVMELVNGVPLTEFCDGNNLSTHDRLVLFVTVCRAVQHAHQKGVIHRDLKPSNVMISMHDGKAMPVIIDFGVSKALSQQLTDKTLFTAYGQMVGTPVYMSPEQAEMSRFDIDTRSDIYSLGVLLYELLTGSTPLDAERLRGTAYAEMQRLIRDVEAPKPSTRLSTLGDALAKIAKQRSTDPKRLGQFLRGDLDWIVMKALEKERDRRYATANSFADDVGRFLRDEVVEARPPSIAYKLRKFARRNKGAVTAGVALAAAILLGIFGTTTGMIRANRQAEHARMMADTAEEARTLAEDNSEQMQQLSCDLALQRGLDLCEQGKVDAGMLWLARSLELSSLEPVDQAVRVNLALWRFNMLPLEQFLPHHGRVTSAIFGSDGKTVLTGTADGAARIWDVQTGKLVGKAMKHESWIRAVAFSPDDKLVLTGSDDRTAQLWDAITCMPVGQPMPHEDKVRAVAFSPDGETVLTISAGTVRLWIGRTGKPIAQLLTHGGRIRTVAFSPDGEMFLTGGLDKTARLWNAKTGEPASEPLMHDDAVWAVAFSPDGSRFATGGDFGVFHIWNSATQGRLPEIEGYYDRIYTLSFSPNGSWIAVGSADLAHVCDAETGRIIHEISVHNGDVTAVAFSGDSKKLLTASTDSTVGVWSAADIDPGRDVLEQDDAVWSVAFSADGSRILTGGVGGIRLWDVATRKIIQDLPLVGTVGAVDYSPDGLRAVVSEGSAAVSEGNTVRLREVPALRPIGQPMEHDRSVPAVAFRSDGSQVLSASYDKTVKLWDGQTGKHITTLHHPAEVRSAAFDPDGSRILTGSVDKTARLWNAHTGQPIGEPLRHQGMVIAVAFSGDGALVATGSSDGLCQIWDSHTHEPVSRSLPHDGRVNAVAFSPDRNYIVTATADRIVRYWDVATGKRIALPRRHERLVIDVAFSPDGKRVVSGSWDGTARLWDAPPPPVKGDVKRIVYWTQVITGLELDQAGTVHVLDRATWSERRQQLQALGGAPLP